MESLHVQELKNGKITSNMLVEGMTLKELSVAVELFKNAKSYSEKERRDLVKYIEKNAKDNDLGPFGDKPQEAAAVIQAAATLVDSPALEFAEQLLVHKNIGALLAVNMLLSSYMD